MKSVHLDAILPVKERQLLAVDYSTDFREGRPINVERRWRKVA